MLSEKKYWSLVRSFYCTLRSFLGVYLDRVASNIRVHQSNFFGKTETKDVCQLLRQARDLQRLARLAREQHRHGEHRDVHAFLQSCPERVEVSSPIFPREGGEGGPFDVVSTAFFAAGGYGLFGVRKLVIGRIFSAMFPNSFSFYRELLTTVGHRLYLPCLSCSLGKIAGVLGSTIAAKFFDK